jgi:DNA ligase-1
VNEIPENIFDYYASEKLDGIRAIWTGTEFVTRHGNVLNPPKWFVSGMPMMRLDGELWMGRGTFNALQSALQTKGGDWHGVKFMIFDLAVLRLKTEQRIELLGNIIFPNHCEIVEHIKLTSHETLDAIETAIVAQGGEGVCLRHAEEFYRPANFIKVKRLFPDIDRWQG